MTLAEISALANAELMRMEILYRDKDNREGLVCRTEPGRKPGALRMGSWWFSAVYAAEGLLDYLRALRLPPARRDREVFWASGEFWTGLRERNLEMIDHAARRTG